MKLKSIQISACILILSIAPLTFTGCVSPSSPAAVKIYKTLEGTQLAVDSARKAFMARVEAGAVDQQTAQRALEASENFNRAYNAAVFAVKTSSAPTPEYVASAAGQFLAIVATFITSKP